MTAVAGYFRVSQARDGMQAPDIYREQIESYCSYKDFDLAGIYADIDYSAYRGAKARPDLERLISERHLYSQVIVPKLSRFGRSMKDLIRLFGIFDQDQIGLVFLDLNIDTKTSQGRLLRHVMSAFAEYESDVKSDYSRASHRHVAELGRPIAGCIYGYRYDKALKNYTIIDDEAAIVGRIYAMYLDGISASAIARALNDDGVPTKRGARWCHRRVVWMLDNPAYAGIRVYRGLSYKAAWQAIISTADWERAQARRGRERLGPRPAPQRYLLTGLMVCESCGETLHHHRCGGQSPRYVCDSYRRVGRRCRGGSMTEVYAHRLVTDAYLERVELLGTRVLGDTARDVDYRAQWAALSVERRNEVLGRAIEKIELLSRRGVGQGRGFRQLRLTWKPSWRVQAQEQPLLLCMAPGNSKVCGRCGYRRDMAMFLRRELPDGWCSKCRKLYRPTGSPAGQSWAEWRKERILFRPLRVLDKS